MERRNDENDWDQLTRRSLLKRGAAGAGLALGAGLFTPTIGSALARESASSEPPALKKILDNIKSKEVIVATYGGDTETARREVFWNAFTKRTGVTVVEADAGNLGDQMQQGLIPTRWDAFHGSGEEVYAALKSGKKPIPRLPKLAWENLIPKKYQPYMFQSFFLGYVPAYLEGTFKGPQPKTWADFFNVKKFPGKRAWDGVAYTPGTRQAALLADGVPPNKIYPMNIKRADAKIKSIWSDFVFYDQFPQAQSFLTSGTVVMSFGPNGLWKELANKGVKVKVMWTAAPILDPNGMNVMPDPPHLDAVTALACFCNNPTLQAKFAELTNYGPPTTQAFSKLSASVKDNLPNKPGRAAVQPNIDYVGSITNKLAADNKKLFA